MLLAVLMGLSSQAFAEDKKKTIPESVKKKYDQRVDEMRKFDSNKDGKLEQDELQKSADTKFDSADTNKDGILSTQERSAALNKMQKQKEETYGETNVKQQANRMNNRFKLADTDKDGEVSKAEFEAYMKNHQANFDRNGDGVISKDEYRTDGERLPGAYIKRPKKD